MRVELFELRFNNTNSIYIAGQVISGSVVIKLAKETWINNISIKFHGRAKSKWVVPNGDTSKRYQATEVYIDSEYQLFKCRDQNDIQPPGMHVYPFDFTLPPEVPSSFEGRRGFVRYQCIVTMDRGWKGVIQIEQDLTVIRHLDLSAVPGAGIPQDLEGEEMYEGCCCDSGNVRARLRLQKSGFVSGEPLYYDMVIHNKATSTICGVVLSLIQTVRYTGYSDSLFSSGNPKYHDKVSNWVLFQSEDGIGAGRSGYFNSYCIIPAVAPSLLEGCGIIDIMYEIHLEVPVGWRTVQLGCNIFIGTIPLRHSGPLPFREPGAIAGLGDGDITAGDLDLCVPPSRQYCDFPPSYEECVFGRMESQEDGDGLDDDDDDNNPDGRAHSQNHTVPATSAAMRRSQFRRLPSYPYYSTDHFTSGGDYLPGWHDENQQEVCPNPSPPPPPPPPPPLPPPPPATNLGYTFVPVTEQPTVSAGLSPPSYESLHLQH
ncbi:unnamed protein product [Candidula unifasciata]|uniref:Arrestin C-terminal-like domain-containing protein n=1 Tax=Candidula unifasciata TaxID=100452 RepID=A0A8S3Z6N4_9EUPU|nr:unnamed protein product [Candidula unifasciata]